MGQYQPSLGQAPPLAGQFQRPQSLPGQPPEALAGQGKREGETVPSKQPQLPSQQQPAGQQGSSQQPLSPQHNAARTALAGMGLGTSSMSAPSSSAPPPQVRLPCIAGFFGSPAIDILYFVTGAWPYARQLDRPNLGLRTLMLTGDRMALLWHAPSCNCRKASKYAPASVPRLPSQPNAEGWILLHKSVM